MVRYALVVEYCGHNYSGWQTQRNTPTIQDSLEKALSKFADHKVATITAGRTDTGVHALNQVVHFDSNANRALHGWVVGVNANLPADIRIKKALIVPNDFDARFSAKSRTYHYYLLISKVNSALVNHNIAWYHNQLDVDKMQLAASMLVGCHDFSSFRASDCQANSPIRTMLQSFVESQGNVMRFTFQANAFLYHMVRNIVGALVYVGIGKLTVEQFSDIFMACNRKLAPPTFMPNGLYMVNVEYDIPIIDFEQDLWLYSR